MPGRSSKRNSFKETSLQTDRHHHHQKEPEENTNSIIEYLEKNYNYLRNMGETQTKKA